MKITNSLKNRVILFLILCITTINVTAQVVPFSTNPIKNPYTNPFGNNQSGTDKSSNKKKVEDKKVANPEDKLNAAKEKIKDKKEEAENTNTADDNTNKEIDNTEVEKNDKELKPNLNIGNQDQTNNVFGMDYFTNSDFNTSDKYSLTPPADYRLGIGDEVIINIFGNLNFEMSLHTNLLVYIKSYYH